jgi:hypothetical protein
VSIGWHVRDVPIKLQFGEKILAAPTVRLRERQIGLVEEVSPVEEPLPPAEPLEPGCEGWMIRSLPVVAAQPTVRLRSGFICYVPSQYPRHYIDLRLGFTAYQQRFSSKTRSTILRKVRKYAEHCGGEIDWRLYQAPEEMGEFFRLARIVSAKTYQEKLLDAGLPDSEDFVRSMEALAREGRVRAFILFDRERPVSYLYCPEQTGAIVYQYLGLRSGLHVALGRHGIAVARGRAVVRRAALSVFRFHRRKVGAQAIVSRPAACGARTCCSSATRCAIASSCTDSTVSIASRPGSARCSSVTGSRTASGS